MPTQNGAIQNAFPTQANELSDHHITKRLVRIQTVRLRLVRGLSKTQSQIPPTSYPGSARDNAMQRGEMEMKRNNEREGKSSWTKPLLSFSPTFIIGR
jgi:hypothetical protein